MFNLFSSKRTPANADTWVADEPIGAARLQPTPRVVTALFLAVLVSGALVAAGVQGFDGRMPSHEGALRRISVLLGWSQPQLSAARRSGLVDASQQPVSLEYVQEVAAALDPFQIRDLSPEDARKLNASVPIAQAPNPAARPFFVTPNDPNAYTRAVDCLAAAVYYEAAYESVDGQRAVAQVILNRLRHPAYPKTVCDVVFQGSERTTGCQFTFTCDGALARTPDPRRWAIARGIASAALNGYVTPQVGHATHYHANYVAPYWAPKLFKVATLGNHIFYRWQGAWGLPGAFRGQHAGFEPIVAKLGGLSSPAPQVELAMLLGLPVLAELEALVVEPSTEAAAPVVLAAAQFEVPAVEEAPSPAAAALVTEAPVALPKPVVVLGDPLRTASTSMPARRSRIAAPAGW